MENWSDEEYETRPLEWTRIYIPKTDAELFDWAPHIKRLKKASLPEKKGGLSTRPYEWMVKGIVPHTRTMARVAVKGGKQ